MSNYFPIIAVVIFLVIIIPLIIWAGTEKAKQDELDMAKWKAAQEQEQIKIGEFKESFKKLSCDEMREKIYNEQVPLLWSGWAKETYKWKPCTEVILP